MKNENIQMMNPPHPGKILKELYINPLGLSITEVAKGLGVTRKTLSALVNERQGISPEMALRLSKSFKTSANLWINMQVNFDLWHSEHKLNLEGVKVMV